MPPAPTGMPTVDAIIEHLPATMENPPQATTAHGITQTQKQALLDNLQLEGP